MVSSRPISPAGVAHPASGAPSAAAARRRRTPAPSPRERRLAATLASLRDVVFTLDLEQRHVEVFGAWLAAEGLVPADFIGKTAADIFGAAAAVPHQEANRRALAGEHVSYEWSTGAPGEERWFQTSLAPLWADDGTVAGLSGVAREVTTTHRSQDALNASNAMLARLTEVQSRFIAAEPSCAVFDRLLAAVLETTTSECGFLGEVELAADGRPCLRTHALTNIAWSEDSRRFVAEHASTGPVPANLTTLFGAVLTERRPVVANDPASDPRRCGLPPGHPPLRSFLGLPLFSGTTMVGMVGIANRPGGYDERLVAALEPLLATCANVITAHRLERQHQAAVAALERSEARYRAIFDGVMVAVWEEDASDVAAALHELRCCGVTEVATHLAAHPEEIARLLRLTRLVAANGETLRLLGASSSEELGARLEEIFTPATWKLFSRALVALAEGRSGIVLETSLRALDGRLLEVLVKVSLPPADGVIKRVVVTVVDLTPLKQAESERERLIVDLQKALFHVKRLSGLLPICSRCKKIRDDDGYWQDVAVYLRDHSEADFTHGICPDCYAHLYADLGDPPSLPPSD